jgi:hypothetical protein
MTISKHQTTMFNKYSRLASDLRDFYRQHKIFASVTSKEFFDARTVRVYGKKDYKDLNQYYKGKLSGIDDTLWDDFYATAIEFGYEVDGKFYSTQKENGTSKIPDEIHRKIVADNIQGFTRYIKTGKVF